MKERPEATAHGDRQNEEDREKPGEGIGSVQLRAVFAATEE